MARQAARSEEDRVDPRDVAGAGETRGQALGGDRDPAQARPVERPGGGFGAAPLLDLDERERRTAPRNQVDFAAGDARADREDSPAVKPQPPRRKRFGAATALLGGGPSAAPAQVRLRSSARA